MYYNRSSRSFLNYDANLTAVIGWGSNSVIQNLFICDINFSVWGHKRDVSVTSSTLKAFMKFWGSCFKFWLRLIWLAFIFFKVAFYNWKNYEESVNQDSFQYFKWKLFLCNLNPLSNLMYICIFHVCRKRSCKLIY